MGMGYQIACTKCGYNFTVMFGVGMMFPRAYEKTVQQAKSGELGEEIQNFLLEHPDGAIDVSAVMGVCKNCGRLENITDLSMYLPKENFSPPETQGRWSVAAPFTETKYVSPWDLKTHYELFAEYPHKCKHCGGELEIFTEKDAKHGLSNLKCPLCHATLNMNANLLWD